MGGYLLTIDQGTSSSRAIIFDQRGQPLAQVQKELRQYYPQDGWVEHDAMEIWHDVLALCRQLLSQSGLAAEQIAAMAITNQRETTVLWDRASGEPIAPAIVWQDRRTADHCQQLKQDGHEEQVKARTGLLLDPYFSASKVAWQLDHVPGARQRAQAGELAFGTIDCWLLWQLTQGRVHATDATNASRTSLFNIHTQQWDETLLALFDVPASLLPEVRDSAAHYGASAASLFGAPITIGALVGDQQAALVGQACFQPGMLKSTYGTGCFMVLNTGANVVQSEHRLLSTVAYRLNGQTTYALEGAIFNAGTTMQWLRDGLKLISQASDSEALARRVGSAGGVYLVPAFTGLGAPWWDPHARGALLGLTRDTGIAEVVTAGLESVCYQSRDLLEAMVADGAVTPSALRVDGGMVANNWLLQCLADTLAVSVERPQVTETTALGAAYLAGLQVGVFDSVEQLAGYWQQDCQFQPTLSQSERQRRYQGWRRAVGQVCQK